MLSHSLLLFHHVSPFPPFIRKTGDEVLVAFTPYLQMRERPPQLKRSNGALCPVCIAKPQKKLSDAHTHTTCTSQWMKGLGNLKKAKVASPQCSKPHVMSSSMTIGKAQFYVSQNVKVYSSTQNNLSSTSSKIDHYPRYCTTTNNLLPYFKLYLPWHPGRGWQG